MRSALSRRHRGDRFARARHGDTAVDQLNAAILEILQASIDDLGPRSVMRGIGRSRVVEALEQPRYQLGPVLRRQAKRLLDHGVDRHEGQCSARAGTRRGTRGGARELAPGTLCGARELAPQSFTRRTETTCERAPIGAGPPGYSLTITNCYVANIGCVNRDSRATIGRRGELRAYATVNCVGAVCALARQQARRAPPALDAASGRRTRRGFAQHLAAHSSVPGGLDVRRARPNQQR